MLKDLEKLINSHSKENDEKTTCFFKNFLIFLLLKDAP